MILSFKVIAFAMSSQFLDKYLHVIIQINILMTHLLRIMLEPVIVFCWLGIQVF